MSDYGDQYYSERLIPRHLYDQITKDNRETEKIEDYLTELIYLSTQLDSLADRLRLREALFLKYYLGIDLKVSCKDGDLHMDVNPKEYEEIAFGVLLQRKEESLRPYDVSFERMKNYKELNIHDHFKISYLEFIELTPYAYDNMLLMAAAFNYKHYNEQAAMINRTSKQSSQHTQGEAGILREALEKFGGL